MRRDKNDKKWQDLKKAVTKRDKKGCRFLRVCTVKEALIIQRLAPKVLLNCLDHAHIFPVSLYPELCYEIDNVILLNRWSHHHLDDCRNPVTGEGITKEERDEYWKKIIGENRYTRLLLRIKGEDYVKEEIS
jgi:hypothetical protein